MNTLRSTERSLTLMALTRAGPLGLKAKRIAQTTSEHFNKNSKRFSSKTTFASRYFRGGPKIKLCYNPIQPLSTAPLIETSLLNPKKATPDEANKLVAPKIVPLTQPRFPKSTSETLPSVTKILQTTMPASSQFILDRWKESMIKKLGLEGFNKYQQDTFARGKALHALLANYLLGFGEPTPAQEEIPEEIVLNLWRSIENVIKTKISNVRLVEHIVTHSDMNYRGIVDCVAFFENELVVIDFKTAEKPKKNVESLYDNPLQVTAYCGAINNDSSIPSHVIDRNICSGLVIVAYIDGSEASTYYLNRDKVANEYWKQWTTRLDQFSRLEEVQKGIKKKTYTARK